MSGVLMDNGSKQIASEARTNWNASTLNLALFKSNTVPTTGDTLATYTESTFPGYARQAITTWTAPTVTGHIASMTAAALTFTRNATGATENVYGYLIIDHAGTVLYAAERDPDAPIPMTKNGDTYTVTPALAIKDVSV